MGEDRTDRPEPNDQRVTVPEAAELLGITAEAVRMRIKRGTLRSERRDGRVFVLLGQGKPTDHASERTDLTDPREELIAQLREEVAAWREEARRKDHLLAAALERIPPQLEAPQKPPETPVSPATPGDGHTGGGEGPGEGSPPPRYVPLARGGSFVLAVLFGLSIGAILVDADLREAPYIDLWGYMAGALYLFPIGFGLAFGYITVANLTPIYGLNAFLIALPGSLFIIAVGASLLGYTGTVLVRLLYSIPVRVLDPDVVLIPAFVSLLGALFFLFFALAGHALHRHREEAAGSSHALTPLKQGAIGILGAFITAIFGFCGILVQVFFASGGTP